MGAGNPHIQGIFVERLEQKDIWGICPFVLGRQHLNLFEIKNPFAFKGFLSVL